MRLRAVLLAGATCLLLAAGCATSASRPIDAPPPVRLTNFQRLGHEFRWFCVSVQDAIFGIDYYDSIENRFAGNLYE
ncbi:MAG: hypothetical protein ACUVYA_17035 [Planctomycetota bacterium]